MNLIVKNNTYQKRLTNNNLYGEIEQANDRYSAVICDDFDYWTEKFFQKEEQARQFILKTFSRYRK